MNPRHATNIHRHLVGITNELEVMLDRNPTSCDLWKWFKAQGEDRQNEIRREIVALKIEEQSCKCR